MPPGQPPQAPPNPAQRAAQRVGSTVLKWRLDALLGVGGTAAVFAATHHNRSRVALKILHRELAVIPELCTRFLREAYVANSVGHEGALGVIDDQLSEQGEPVLVMPLLEGHPLDVLRETRGTLPVDEALHYADQVLEVLSAAHARGVVHRDIKPQNIFVTNAGAVKVLDFGVARLFDGNASLTQTGMLVGTPAFMPPEQASGRTGDIGPTSDLWALGATVFTLLTGHFVHEAENAQQHTVKAAVFPARSVATLRPDLPAPVVEWIDKALSFEIKHRFTSADHMRKALSAVRAQLAGTAAAPRPAPAGRASRPDGMPPTFGAPPPAAPAPNLPVGAAPMVAPSMPVAAPYPAAPAPAPQPPRDAAAIARAHGLPPPAPKRPLTTAEKAGIVAVAVAALVLAILVLRGLASRSSDAASGTTATTTATGLSPWIGDPTRDTPGSLPAPATATPSQTATQPPSPSPSSTDPAARKFVPEEGRAALDLGEAESRRCAKQPGPKGRMSVEVTFYPDGDTTAQVEIRFARTPAGICVEEAFRNKAKVPPFTGTSVTTTRMITLPE